jgi:hypothetical protein
MVITIDDKQTIDKLNKLSQKKRKSVDKIIIELINNNDYEDMENDFNKIIAQIGKKSVGGNSVEDLKAERK